MTTILTEYFTIKPPAVRRKILKFADYVTDDFARIVNIVESFVANRTYQPYSGSPAAFASAKRKTQCFWHHPKCPLKILFEKLLKRPLVENAYGQIIATSEGYKAIASYLNGIKSVKKNAPEAEITEVEAR